MKKCIAIILGLALALCAGAAMAGSAETLIWLNDNAAAPYATLKEAAAASQAGDVIRVKGSFAHPAVQATIPAGRTLAIAGDTTVTGVAGQNGIVVASGAAVKCENGATLTMKDFAVALTVNAGGQMNDGNYVFQNNASGTDYGVRLMGLIKGSGDKSSLKVTVRDKNATNVYGSTTIFENCTVDIDSGTRTWFDGHTLTMSNASLSMAGYGRGFYINTLSMENSELTISRGGATGMTLQGAGNVINSTITVNSGSTAGFSIGGKAGLEQVFIGSVINLNNSGVGGLNVNTGMVTLDGSTLRTNGAQSVAFGVQNMAAGNHLTFINGAGVETPATAAKHNGGSQLENAYVVLGGTHRIFYSDQLPSIPVNGTEYGNEKLDHFQLANAALTALNPVDKTGKSYAYPIPHASDDGQRYVWVPGDNVIFQLNNPDAAYADGTKEDKTVPAMRGYAVADAVAANGKPVTLPQTPVAPGQRFVGWFIKADDKPFDPTQYQVMADTEVVAKWESDASSYMLVYHNDAAPDATYSATGNAPSRKIKALPYQDVLKGAPAFARPGMEFVTWVDERGQEVAPGSEVTVPENQTTAHLHAKWKDVRFTVRFSANGGVFGPESVFKTKPKVFSIETDAAGGEVAVVKDKAVSGTKVLALLQSLDSTVSSYDVGLYLSTDNIKKVASRPDYVVKSSGTSWWGTPQYSWYEDALGAKTVNASSAAITADTTYYLVWKPEQEPVAVPEQQLPADMWGDAQGDTVKVKPVFAGEPFTVTAAIETAGIKQLMKQLETQLTANMGNSPDLKQIALDGVTSSFVAKLTLPAGMVMPKELTAERLAPQGFGKAFEVTEVKTAGNVLTVVMTFRAAGIANYQLLKESIDSTAPWMTLSVPGVTVDGTAADGAKLTAVGTVAGKFNAIASHNATKLAFDIAWTGVQTPQGKDSGTPDGDRSISYTVQVVRPVALALPGDMLINGDTEHQAVYEVTAGETVALTGALNIKDIQAQMEAIEAPYQGKVNFADIAVDVKKVEFIANITLPNGLSFASDAVELRQFGDFIIKGKEINGQKMTMTMTAPAGIANYQQLHDLVFNAGGADGWMMAVVSAVKVADDASAAVPLTAVGTLTGEMHATATSPAGTLKAFSFTWHAVQNAEGKDAIAADDATIQASLVPVSTVAVTLPGDMLVNGDTEHTDVYEVTAGETVALTGALNVQAIRDQMTAIEAPYQGKVNFADIAVDVKKVEFVARLTLPRGMTFAGDAVTPENFGDFQVAGKTISADTAVITMTAPNTIKNYQQLHDLVFNAGDAQGWMKVTLPGVKIGDNVMPGALITATGTLTGEMQATATSPSGTRKVFSFAWQAEQWPDGLDAAAPDDDKSIRLTVVPVPVIESALPGDMLVNGDTEHTKVYEVKKGDAVAVTGALNVQEVRRQMKNIEALYPNTDQNTIAVDVKKAEFVAAITLPEGMTFPAGAVAAAESFGAGFELVSTTVAGQTATVKMKLKDGIRTYPELQAAVNAAGDADGWMKITIAGVKVSDAVADDQQLTSVGTVRGEMQATASVPTGARKAFSFVWNATQWPEGKDAVAADDVTIQMTVVARAKPVPPVVPPTEKPVTPSYSPVSVSLSGKKTAVNHRLKGGDYEFVIKDGSGKVRQTVTNDRNGLFTFKARTFSKTGTFMYTIEEVAGGKANITYDKTVYKVKVTTTAAGGSLKADVTLLRNGTPYDGGIVFVNTNNVPKTGDAGVMLPLALAMAAMAVMGLTIMDKKKKLQ